ncbi:MAG: hypothetical protein FWH37_01195 [Candidatus Bathyarchaeota archaeon]|nr:hypothetical protein [Candidatus Termiticorpusculum sp.]
MKKVTFLTLASLLLIFLFFALFSSIYAEQTVGFKEGDWMEYDVVVTGTGSLPPTHDVRWMRMEVLSVDGDAFSVDMIVRFVNGTIGSSVWEYNFTEGNTGGWTIIPANLGFGDTFFDSYFEPYVVPIRGEEQREVLGAVRTVTYGNDSIRHHKEWDKATGFFIGSVEVAQNFTNSNGWYIENLTMTIQATGTNMWTQQFFGLDQFVFVLFVLVLVLVVVGLISGLIIWKKKFANSNSVGLKPKLVLMYGKKMLYVFIVCVLLFSLGILCKQLLFDNF